MILFVDLDADFPVVFWTWKLCWYLGPLLVTGSGQGQNKQGLYWGKHRLSPNHSQLHFSKVCRILDIWCSDSWLIPRTITCRMYAKVRLIIRNSVTIHHVTWVLKVIGYSVIHNEASIWRHQNALLVYDLSQWQMEFLPPFTKSVNLSHTSVYIPSKIITEGNVRNSWAKELKRDW